MSHRKSDQQSDLVLKLKRFCCSQTRVKSFEWVTLDRLALDSATIELPLVVVQIWDFCHQMIITFSE